MIRPPLPPPREIREGHVPPRLPPPEPDPEHVSYRHDGIPFPGIAIAAVTLIVVALLALTCVVWLSPSPPRRCLEPRVSVEWWQRHGEIRQVEVVTCDRWADPGSAP